MKRYAGLVELFLLVLILISRLTGSQATSAMNILRLKKLVIVLGLLIVVGGLSIVFWGKVFVEKFSFDRDTSFKIDYPNEFDRMMAQRDGRSNLGGDIFFHGKSLTRGCIPVGDEAIEEIFLLVHEVGMQHVEVIIAPADFRNGAARPEIHTVDWEHILYEEIKQALKPFTERI